MTTLRFSLLNRFKSKIFVETGTLNGDGIEVALQCGFERVFSIEIDHSLVVSANNRFRNEISEGRVCIVNGDSSVEFPKILRHLSSEATFWLDSHWDGGVRGLNVCTLYDELDAIAKHSIKTHSILIDDRRIFGGKKTNWGANVSEKEIIDKLKDINHEYKIIYADGYVEDDIICASVGKLK